MSKTINSKYIKQIQSKLNHRGHKVTTTVIREAYPLIVKDINDPTTDEINAVVEQLLNDSALNVQNATGILDETEQTTQIEEIEEMIDNTPQESNALTFDNKFAKAGALEKVFVDNSIVATDTELMAISVDIENDFDSEDDFIVTAIQAWEDYQIGLLQSRVDTVQSTLANIRTKEVMADESIKSSMKATSDYIKNLRIKQEREFSELTQNIKKARSR